MSDPNEPLGTHRKLIEAIDALVGFVRQHDKVPGRAVETLSEEDKEQLRELDANVFACARNSGLEIPSPQGTEEEVLRGRSPFGYTNICYHRRNELSGMAIRTTNGWYERMEQLRSVATALAQVDSETGTPEIPSSFSDKASGDSAAKPLGSDETSLDASTYRATKPASVLRELDLLCGALEEQRIQDARTHADHLRSLLPDGVTASSGNPATTTYLRGLKHDLPFWPGFRDMEPDEEQIARLQSWANKIKHVEQHEAELNKPWAQETATIDESAEVPKADVLKGSLTKEVVGAGNVANSPATEQEKPESEERPDSEENSANRYDQRRTSILKELPKYQRRAYFTLQLIQAKHERKLNINEAYRLLSEDGIPDDIELTGELKVYVESGELEDYELPKWGAWDKAQREARSALGELRKESRSGRPTGRSIARPDEIE